MRADEITRLNTIPEMALATTSSKAILHRAINKTTRKELNNSINKPLRLMVILECTPIRAGVMVVAADSVWDRSSSNDHNNNWIGKRLMDKRGMRFWSLQATKMRRGGIETETLPERG